MSGRVRQRVGEILKRIGRFQVAVLLSLVYLLLWFPIGLLTRFLADWLHFKPPAKTNWWVRSPRLNDPSHLKELF